MNLTFASIYYRSLRERIREQDPTIDERTLADTVEGLTELPDILVAILRAALEDEALAAGLKSRIGEMQERLARLEDRASKRRAVARDVMVEADIKKLTAPDLTASIRPGTPALMVVDESLIPSIFWEPANPKLKRQELVSELRQGSVIAGATLTDPTPVLSVRTR